MDRFRRNAKMYTDDTRARNDRFQALLDQRARGYETDYRTDPDPWYRRPDQNQYLGADCPHRLATEAVMVSAVGDGPLTRYQIYRRLTGLPEPRGLYTTDYLDPILHGLVGTGQLAASETDLRLAVCLFSIPEVSREKRCEYQS